MKNFYLIFFLLLSNIFVSQELNCEVVVEARQTGNENLQVFKTLQTQLTEFINSTSWTNKAVRQNEKIDCTMFINISSYENDVFQEPFKYNHQDQYLIPHTIHQLIILMTGISLLIIKNSKILLLTKISLKII